MKRSEINACIKDMERLIKAHGFELPPFCSFTPEEWKEKNHEYDEIRDNMLGWDITDYGLGDFSKVGLKMKQLRSERGITQEQVAKDLNCTVPFVSNVENNRAKLNLRVLLYYSKLCNVSVDTILDAGRDIPPLDEKEHQLNDEMLNVFRGFSVTAKEKIIKMLRIWQEK